LREPLLYGGLRLTEALASDLFLLARGRVQDLLDDICNRREIDVARRGAPIFCQGDRSRLGALSEFRHVRIFQHNAIKG
jgi:hypothetical protein